MSQEFASVTTGDGFTVEGNTDSADKMKANFDADDSEGKKTEEKERVSKAASELGKKGGEAAAKARDTKPAEPESKGKEAKPEDKKAEDPRFSARARVEEATRKLSEERRLRAAAEQRLAEALSQQRPAQTFQPQVQAAGNGQGKPKIEDFAQWEDFNEALVNWTAAERIRETVERMTTEQRARSRAEAEVATKLQHVEKFKASFVGEETATPELMERVSQDLLNGEGEYEGFVSSIVFERHPQTNQLGFWGEGGAFVPVRMTPEMAIMDEIVGAERPLALAAYLSEHPEEIQRLRTLTSTYAIARAMGSIEAKLDKAESEPAKPKQVQVSQAKPPIKPVAGGRTGGDDDVEEIEDFDAYVRAANARDRRRATGR